MADMNSNLDNSETINLALREHQASVDWRFTRQTTDLHVWVQRMNLEFKLQIDDIPVLQIERLRRCLGHYRPGRNGFGLRDEIAIHEDHLCASPHWRVLGTLLHELLHCWQEHFGKKRPGSSSRNYHNREFRDKAANLGLIIDQRGRTQYAPGETPFLNLLSKYGIEVSDMPAPMERQGLSSRRVSKLKLYMCPCGVKVRIGRSRFHAKCLDCGGIFEKK